MFRILTFQLHVKDLNKTIRYMHKHKMYQKVTSVPECLGGGRSLRKVAGAEATLAQLALGTGRWAFWVLSHSVSFAQCCPRIHWTS